MSEMKPDLLAVDWTGHSWRERIFCCIGLLSMEGLVTPDEHIRIVRRAARALDGRKAEEDVPVMLKRQAD
jgi:hypothetical protein